METKAIYSIDKLEIKEDEIKEDEIKEGTKEEIKEEYTIKDILDRYGLKTRQSFYSWAKTVGITVGKDNNNKSIVTADQIVLLDELNQHLKNGGLLKTFTPTSSAQVIKNESVHYTIDTIGNNKNIMKTGNDVSYQQLELFDAIVNRVTEIINVSPINRSPINHWDELNKAVENNYILTSKEIKELLGTKPFGTEWIRGAFKFVKVGKIGNQSGWKVIKISI